MEIVPRFPVVCQMKDLRSRIFPGAWEKVGRGGPKIYHSYAVVHIH